jgi:hypothetical protein
MAGQHGPLSKVQVKLTSYENPETVRLGYCGAGLDAPVPARAA